MQTGAVDAVAGASRHQFLLLDGLRGVAALAVVLFHMHDWFAGGHLFTHGYIAVDFFFVLSGFVIAHAYSARLGHPGDLFAFAQARVLRLYPLLLLGTVAGIAIYLLRTRAQGLPIDREVIANCVASLIPFPALWNDNLFPIDPAVWSLFWELVVNIAFALVLHRLRSVTLIVMALLLGAALIARVVLSGSVDLGPYHDGWEFGGVRAFYGFIVGMLLLRWLRAHPPRHRRRQIWTVLAVIAMLTAMPARGGWSADYDLLLIIAINPLVVLAAARSAPIAHRLETWSGAVSYPLYIVHTPILLLLGGALTRLHAPEHMPKWVIGLGIAVSIVALADALDRWFDVPVRRYLRRRMA